jgi:hypothetical protein
MAVARRSLYTYLAGRDPRGSAAQSRRAWLPHFPNERDSWGGRMNESTTYFNL